MRLDAHGIATELPPGWEGTIGRRPDPAVDPASAPSPTAAAAATTTGPPATGADEQVLPTAHLASFPLPPDLGDFGSGAVELMTGTDAFVALVEYGPEAVDTPLFAAPFPRRLDARAFRRAALQRTLPGQVGTQVFCTEGGRALCVYVVLGRATDLAPLLVPVNATLAATEIAPR